MAPSTAARNAARLKAAVENKSEPATDIVNEGSQTTLEVPDFAAGGLVPGPVVDGDTLAAHNAELHLQSKTPTDDEIQPSNAETGTTSPNVADAPKEKKVRFSLAEDVPARTYHREKRKYDDHVDFAFENFGKPVEIHGSESGAAVSTIRKNYATDVRDLLVGDQLPDGTLAPVPYKIHVESINDRVKGRRRVFLKAVPVGTPDVQDDEPADDAADEA